MNTMNRTSATIATTTIRDTHHVMDTMVPTIAGIPEMILANRIMEMPLPIPNSVICSPSHITMAEPAVKARMMVTAGRKPSFVMMEKELEE